MSMHLDPGLGIKEVTGRPMGPGGFRPHAEAAAAEARWSSSPWGSPVNFAPHLNAS